MTSLASCIYKRVKNQHQTEESESKIHITMATIKTFFPVAIIGLALISMTTAACDDCPLCPIFSPICATYHTQYATNNRRVFSSECHMHCYNKCHGTKYFKLYPGTKC